MAENWEIGIDWLLCLWRFPRQEYWSGLPFPPPGDLPDPGIEPMFPALAGGFLTAEPPGKPEVREVMSHLFAVKPVNTAVSMAWGTGGGHAPVIPQLNNP